MTVVWLAIDIIHSGVKEKKIPHPIDHRELFEMHKEYCSPFSCHMMEIIIEKLMLKHSAFKTVHAQMVTYNRDMGEFRRKTRLDQFCQAIPFPDNCTHSPFIESEAYEFPWPTPITLQDVEEFRKQLAVPIDLRILAVLLNMLTHSRLASFNGVP